MAADCEIAGCGIQAVARCINPACEVSGGAAYCISHGPLPAGWCALCRARQAVAKEAAAQAIQDVRERVVDLARALVAAGVRPPDRYSSGRRTVKSLFGRLKEVADPSRDLYGWYVGEYYWQTSKESSAWDTGNKIRRMRTFITTEGAPIADGWRQVGTAYLYTESDADGFGGSYGGFDSLALAVGRPGRIPTTLDVWKEILERMEAIARSSGVEL